MLVFPTLNIGSLQSVMLSMPHMTARPLAVFASPESDMGLSHSDRMLLQGLGWTPIERRSFGAGRGSISVMRLDRDAILDRQRN